MPYLRWEMLPDVQTLQASETGLQRCEVPRFGGWQVILYLLFVAAVYCLLLSSPQAHPLFAWYDVWVGLFYDRKRRVLYIFLLPCLGVEWQRERRL